MSKQTKKHLSQADIDYASFMLTKDSGRINASDLMYLDRLISIRKDELSKFRNKICNFYPETKYTQLYKKEKNKFIEINSDPLFPLFKEIDKEIQILDTLYNKFCKIFENQHKDKK